MVNIKLNQYPEPFQPVTDPWQGALAQPIPQHPSETLTFSLGLPPILSPVSIPDAAALSAGMRKKSPTVQFLLRWGLKLSPTDHSVAGLRDALALLMWQASICQLSQILIEEELRLNVFGQDKLKTQIQKALALLFWLGQGDAMMPA
ncbi:hypothetical protein HRE53_28755 (plasmid) [Acaryochloris sp. 'Moss Beach']|uniref:hypothetical protein n=1 Tax=Acaryochloris TaxID=155977 RepID=UPI001BAFA0DC|nr:MULTISPECIES: hypothetical protein [Acaryochloris]QUY46132.1 hypothetical protein I1H34_30765 [Acaryochloris marina S15]UJB72739.1 hypothetical protein HRE53_28755 [Acaryochloris sp. 'Moss Beach']